MYRNCYECGCIEQYCEKCKVYHHKDSFKIECIEYQLQLKQERKNNV